LSRFSFCPGIPSTIRITTQKSEVITDRWCRDIAWSGFAFDWRKKREHFDLAQWTNGFKGRQAIETIRKMEKNDGLARVEKNPDLATLLKSPCNVHPSSEKDHCHVMFITLSQCLLVARALSADAI